jgi:hypothetical protein
VYFSIACALEQAAVGLNLDEGIGEQVSRYSSRSFSA